jgi:hypothetical protein
MLERWRNDFEYRALMSEVTREHWSDPKFRALMSEAMRERWPEWQVPVLEILKGAKRKQ